MKVLDVGAGHLRNLKLFDELGFKNLYALDLETTDNPLKVSLKDFKLQDIEKGLPYKDKEFDILLCNYVLMFINPKNIDFVVSELMRVTKGFLIIETNPQKYKDCHHTFFKDYDFDHIAKQIEKNIDFELLQVRKSHEKITAKRKGF